MVSRLLNYILTYTDSILRFWTLKIEGEGAEIEEFETYDTRITFWTVSRLLCSFFISI